MAPRRALIALFGEASQQIIKHIRLFKITQVPGGGNDGQPGTGDFCRHQPGVGKGCGMVLLADDDKGRAGDGAEMGH